MALTVSNGTLATLSVQQGPLTGQQFSITQPSVTIGRTVGNDIVINDSEVSRHHVRITWNGQQFVIEDLGSTNGTFVNGVRITTPQPLVPGASLRLGTLDLRFQSSLAAAVSEPVTHVSMPVQQQSVPAPVYSPPYAVAVNQEVRHRGCSSSVGRILLLALIAVALGRFCFWGAVIRALPQRSLPRAMAVRSLSPKRCRLLLWRATSAVLHASSSGWMAACRTLSKVLSSGRALLSRAVPVDPGRSG